jgi:hypothetical protein
MLTFRPSMLVVVAVVAVSALSAPATNAAKQAALPRLQASRLTTTTNPAFTLANIDHACFYAPGGAGSGWPFRSFGVEHPIRGSFNETRALNGSHFGVDVSATKDEEAVYAIDGGIVTDRTKHTMSIGDGGGHRWVYWHLNDTTRWKRGTQVQAHEYLGTILGNVWHVHISEWAPGCHWVDPRRPTGNFFNPKDTQTPTMGPLTADVANDLAFAEPTNIDETAQGADPAEPMKLDALRGVVDLRANVVVPGPESPIDVVGGHTRIPDLAVSAIRAWLTTPSREHSHIELQTIMDGSRLVSNPNLWHKWAWGSGRQNECFYGHGICSQAMIWHVGGQRGLNTRAYPNGRYLYCVAAITINSVTNHRCTPVTIRN